MDMSLVHVGISSPGFDAEVDMFGGGAPLNGGPDLESFEMLGGDEVAKGQCCSLRGPRPYSSLFYFLQYLYR